MRLLAFFFLINWIMMRSALAQKVIHFTVPINLKFPDNGSRKEVVSDEDSTYLDECILKLPPNYTPDKPVRLVYMAHGAGGGVSSTKWFLNQFSLQDSLLANGYALFDVNGGPLVENMGGSWVVQAAYKAYQHIRDNYSVLPEVLVAGFSMGGLSSTNFVYKHSNIVIAHAMFSPVLDLYEQAWNNPWLSTTRKAIATTYNFNDTTGKTWESNQINGWNPLWINTFYNGKDTVKIYPVPVKIWHGTGDKVVTVSASRNFHHYLQNAGGYSELREINSDDHGLSCGKDYINHELLLFFKRFDK